MSKIKDSYKIPHSINVKKGLDDPVALKSGSVGLSSPVPVKIIVMVVITIGLYISGVTFMLVGNYGILAAILFSIGFLGLSRMMLRKDQTGERGYMWVWPTLSYFPSYKLRTQSTRGTAKGNEVERLKSVIPIESIESETGLAYYVNGDVGYAYNVVGNGSRSLFDKEKEDIVVSYDQFLREIDMGVYITFDMKEGAQDCSTQINNLENKRLEKTNATRDMILKRRISGLQNIEKNFKTTEYTMFIRANDKQKLDTTIKILKQKERMGMFKYLERAKNEEVFEKYRNYFSME